MQNFLQYTLSGVCSFYFCFCFCSLTAMAQTTPKSPSGGRVESPCKGLSGMDAARAAMGQGWPFAACPWSGDGAREPRRSRGRMAGCVSLLTFFCTSKESESPVRGETQPPSARANDPCQAIEKSKTSQPAGNPPNPQLPSGLNKPHHKGRRRRTLRSNRASWMCINPWKYVDSAINIE